jgi:glycosyltransferase involved in cell wall biosynthesis
MAGLPVISTSVGGVPEVIHDMQNGVLVHPQNPKEMAEAILYLLDHKENRKEFGHEIKKTISNFFSLEKMLEETVKLYR